jgi:hypothetical protein
MRRTHFLSLLILTVAVAGALFGLRSMADVQVAGQPTSPGDQADSLRNALEGVKQAQQGQAPGQPIPQFSHKIHAGDNHIPCLYCHIGADKSPVARVPAVSTCMGCHKLVGTDKPGVILLTQYWNRQQAIPWVKVNDVPDHVRFTHERHVQAGIACQTCHGEIQTEDHVKLAHTLNMGFCVTCHKARLNDPVHATSLDCATCHK